MRSILTSIGLCLFWIAWAPCALIKDAVQLLYIPFDTQRLVNTYIQSIRNAQALGPVWTPVPPQTPEPPKQTGHRVIGFTGRPPEQPGDINGPVCTKRDRSSTYIKE